MKRKNKKKKAASKRQQFSYKPLILVTVPEGESENIINEQIQEIKRAFNTMVSC